MDRLTPGLKKAQWLLVLLLVLSVFSLPASGAPNRSKVIPVGMLSRLSQSAAIRYLMAHPERAPERLRERVQAARQVTLKRGAAAGTSTGSRALAGVGALFNRDNTGFPQNEESVTACGSGTTQQASSNIVLGGTNDYRGFLNQVPNITGWHYSTDGGRTVRKEGQLPPVRISGQAIPSGGDPVFIADANCNLYGGSLNYNGNQTVNGIGVYRTTPATLNACPGGTAPSCWPTRRAVAVGGPDHFLDKEWIYVGRSGAAGTVVWVTYTDFLTTGPNPNDFTASIKAVRCNAALTSCTTPILISGNDQDVQFSDVTIGPDGKTYITWSEIQGELEGTAQTFIHKLRVAPAGSTSFGPERVVVREPRAIPFGGFLNANDFRVATYPKNEVRMVNGKPRVFVVWDACAARVFDTVCELPVIKLRTSDNLGATWSTTTVVSSAGGNYFPTIHSDRSGAYVAISYFTNRFDPQFNNRQDLELVTLNPSSKAVVKRQRLTSVSNESEADPLLGGFFIGDYIEVFAKGNTAYVHYNANYRKSLLVGEGLPVPQQDNYLARADLRP